MFIITYIFLRVTPHISSAKFFHLSPKSFHLNAQSFHFTAQSFHLNAQSFHLKLRKLLILSHFSIPKHMKLLNVLKQHRQSPCVCFLEF